MTPDEQEQQLRIDLMTIQIERLRQEIKMENRKFYVQFTLAVAAAFAAGVAFAHFVLHG
jgi:hypothetical protein